MADMDVDLVAVERRVWSGTATEVLARTTEGELGVLPGHEPLLGELVDGVVTVRVPDGDDITAAVHGGFFSVTGDKVTILAESAQLAGEIDVAAERRILQETDSADGRDPTKLARARGRALTRLQAVGHEA